jgi:putative component of membrane protein insertase Oxa1/YidC/SpoIIIJ protein YidD
MVIERDGVVSGGWKAIARIVRCGPWTPAGTRDEP